jgi:HD-like signal output (HDOD) protein
MQRVDKVLERVSELPFSPVAFKILEAARDEQVGTREIARIIGQDQAFTARLLKIANSPHYAQTRTVTTVTQAVPVLGSIRSFRLL